jgi:hypothetical protein
MRLRHLASRRAVVAKERKQIRKFVFCYDGFDFKEIAEMLETQNVFVVSSIFNEQVLEEASLAAVEWMATEDAKKIKTGNFMQKSVFTPLYWGLMDYDKAISIETLAVLGRMLGYCQMANGSCSASLSTIARQVHLSLRTVKRCVKILEVRGYMDDLTPNRLKAPHSYEPTERLIKILSKAGVAIHDK